MSELVSQALLDERGDVRRWYMQEFQAQTAEQAATIDQHIGETKEMMIEMYNKIKEYLRAAVRGNIMRMEEIVDVAIRKIIRWLLKC